MSLDIRRVLSAMTQVIGNEIPDATLLAAALAFDLSQAQITTTKSVMAVRQARLKPDDFVGDIFWGIIPRHEICVLIRNSSLLYRDVEGETFGANQQLVPSKYSSGFGVVFERDGWTCGFTADSPEATIEFIFCHAPIQARVPPRRGSAAPQS